RGAGQCATVNARDHVIPLEGEYGLLSLTPKLVRLDKIPAESLRQA
ncbi:MAG: hypothetical protein JWP08_4310, partial [Bryobacterales bacterium]|nr:hypothetical protein [Bryobacterales bacterium]